MLGNNAFIRRFKIKRKHVLLLFFVLNLPTFDYAFVMACTGRRFDAPPKQVQPVAEERKAGSVRPLVLFNRTRIQASC